MTREPGACSDAERRAFARLVREGFDSAVETLDGRIRAARWLAFHYAADDALEAVAALKSPREDYRRDIFRQADAPASGDDYTLELGWVFVRPAHRRNRIAARLCRQLLERVPASPVFATTRPINVAMIRILEALGFARAGTPYRRRRDEELVLFLRAVPPAAG